MSDRLTREQVEHLVRDGGEDSAELYLQHDAAWRKECADAQQRYETQCAGTKSRMEENQQLRQQVADLTAKLAKAEKTMSGATSKKWQPFRIPQEPT